MSFGSGWQTGLGRQGSVSSIALANLHAQREGNSTSSPRPPPPKLPTPPPPRDDKSRFSALGSGGPSDWEHFGADVVIDDEEIFAKKPQPAQLDSVELPASQPELAAGPSPPSTHGWPTLSWEMVVGSHPNKVHQHSNSHNISHHLPRKVSSWKMEAGQCKQFLFKIDNTHLLNSLSSSLQCQQILFWETQHAAEIKAKDEEIERLRADAEQAKADLRNELEKLKADIEVMRATTADEKTSLQEQLDAMRTVTADQAKTNADAATREKELTIERMKEDVEGKEHNIEERNAIIADLRRQLEAEKSKKGVKTTPTPGDLIPDLDPWYAGSLQRYITMLRGEASEAQVEEKIKTFRAFVKAESGIRSIEFHDTPPPAPANTQNVLSAPRPEASNLARDRSETFEEPQNASNVLNKPSLDHKQELNVGVPQHQESLDDDGNDYSPGGRPPWKSYGSMQSKDIRSAQDNILPPVMAPDASKRPLDRKQDLNVQVPPQQKSPDDDDYEYSPGGRPVLKRKATIPPNDSGPAQQVASSKQHDEIFFGAAAPETSKVSSRPTSSDSTTRSIPVPAPLTLSSNRSVSTAPAPKQDPSSVLNDLLPSQIVPATSKHLIEDIKTKLANLNQNTANVAELTKQWDKTAAVTRRKYDDARRKRQEENEENNDDAFNNNEISYADLNVLEEEFKEKEAGLKAQEDRDEYKSYVEAVFDQVYDALQADIKDLMDIYVEAENLLHTSVSSIRNLEADNEAPSTQVCLELLQDLHNRILDRQDHVVAAVVERDKRYKKTETQPLYAAGNITKMKAVEKHFENAEKQAIVRAKRDKAGRVGEIVGVAEEFVVNAVGVEQREIDAIVAAIHSLDDASADPDLLLRALDTLAHLKSSSKYLLSLLNTMEIAHNAAVLEAEIAQAKSENADATRIKQLEDEKTKGEKKFMDEFKRRIDVIDQDKAEIEELVREKGGKGIEEVEKGRRLKAALEEAKRRNGHA
ncbi:hypothetical protein EK21DRAFT_57805 [Setomelanomma holmii]|uniref:Uncharacterized protein n=1 Tax=Setomelanomma holmii TaxID=210430 RepID=A0A9P4HF87_9PLEO|nr:hypothetical protein EK21DRAFT_57805 [Setomelanomma holmii]